MSNGILIIAFGEKFDNMAADSVAYSRQHTDLEITVLSNLKKRTEKWDKIANVKFINFDLETKDNRKVKTSMINHSPYDKTIYIDADSIVQRAGIEKIFDKLGSADILLNVYGKWVDRIPLSYYRVAMTRLKETMPIYIYYGAFVGFTKSDGAVNFFKQWNNNYKISLIAREMPSLACTIKKDTKLNLVKCNSKDNIFSWKVNPLAIIQHEYGALYWRKFFPNNTRIEEKVK